MSSTHDRFDLAPPVWAEARDYDAYQSAVKEWASAAVYETESDAYLARIVEEFGHWAALAQPSYRQWHQRHAFYAAVYRYAREIQKLARTLMLGGMIAIEGDSGSQEQIEVEERLQALLVAHGQNPQATD